MALGTTYVRVPVKKLVKLHNLTQIDTRYEWDVSRATALGLHLRIEPRQVQCLPRSAHISPYLPISHYTSLRLPLTPYP